MCGGGGRAAGAVSLYSLERQHSRAGIDCKRANANTTTAASVVDGVLPRFAAKRALGSASTKGRVSDFACLQRQTRRRWSASRRMWFTNRRASELLPPLDFCSGAAGAGYRARSPPSIHPSIQAARSSDRELSSESKCCIPCGPIPAWPNFQPGQSVTDLCHLASCRCCTRSLGASMSVSKAARDGPLCSRQLRRALFVHFRAPCIHAYLPVSVEIEQAVYRRHRGASEPRNNVSPPPPPPLCTSTNPSTPATVYIYARAFSLSTCQACHRVR